MDDLGDNLHSQFLAFAQKAEQLLKKLPLLAANRAKNFFQDRFRDQAWYDTTYAPWKKRKIAGKKNAKSRAILTDSGHLKRGTRIKQADWSNVIVGNDVPYAEAHNNGFKGTVTVRGHARIASRKVATRFKRTVKGKKVKEVALKSGRKKIRGASHAVKTHQRKMNLPQRQFIGNSALLNRLIQRDFTNELRNL